MKRFTFIGLTATIFLMCFTLLSNSSQACVDPDSILVSVQYDSSYTDIAIKVSNIKLFSASPTQFCSCAVTSWTDVFSMILYVAFVDSGTMNPIGFDPWTADGNASNAWESVLATGNWNGFVGQVAAGGAFSGVPVELIIRAQLPAGYTFSFLDSAIQVTQLGTDEWDNTNQTLANSHQEIFGFWENGGPTYKQEDSTFFNTLDASITTSISRIKQSPSLTLFPNPANNFTRLKLDASNRFQTISIFDLQGREIYSLLPPRSILDEIDLDISMLTSGLYLMKVETVQGVVTRKLVLE